MAKIVYACALLVVLLSALPYALNAEAPAGSPAGSLFVSEGKAVEVEVETSWFNWFLQSAGASNADTDSLAAAAPEAQGAAAPAASQGKTLRYIFLW